MHLENEDPGLVSCDGQSVRKVESEQFRGLSDHQNIEFLNRLLDKVKRMPLQEAKALLDKSSPFWNSLHETRPLFTNSIEYELYLSLYLYAHDIGSHGHKSSIALIMDEMQATCLDIQHSVYERSVKTLLESPVAEADLRKVAQILESMSARGLPTMLGDSRRKLQLAVLALQQEGEKGGVSERAHERVRRVMSQCSGQASLEEEIQAMHDSADWGNWAAFWNIWRAFPAAMRPRPSQLYCVMFQRTAMRQHQAKAIQCLVECIPEMEIEEPPVEMDVDIAHAVKACLLVAAPGIEDTALKEDSASVCGRLWRRCDEVGSSRNSDQPG